MDLVTPPRVQFVGSMRRAVNVSVTSEQQDFLEKTRDTLNNCFGDEDVDSQLFEPPRRRRRRGGRTAVAKQRARRAASKRRIRKKATSDAEQNQSAHEEQDEENEGESIPRPRRRRHRSSHYRRTCKKKMLSIEDKKVAAVREYLARLGITWQKSQMYHNRNPVTADAGQCRDQNGFTELQTRLSNSQMPSCLTCFGLLTDCGFKLEQLEEELATCERGDLLSPCSKLRRCFEESGMEEQQPRDFAACLNPSPEEEGPEQEKSGDEPVQADEQVDIWQIVKEMRCLQVLERDTHGKRNPVRCLACKSKKQREGKIFEIPVRSKKNIDFYVKQHCRTSKHIASVQNWIRQHGSAPDDDNDDSNNDEQPPEKVPCVGFSLTNPGTKVSEMAEELRLWARNTNLISRLTQHEYVWKLATEELIVFNKKCLKIVQKTPGKEKNICSACHDHTIIKTAIKNATRFAHKHWAARILHARLFRSEQAAAELEKEFKQTNFFNARRETMEQLLEKSKADLQIWVRKGWAKMPKEQINPTLQNFMNTIVFPCLEVNVVDCNLELRQMANQLSQNLASKELSAIAEVSARIAEAACSGKFAQRPAFLGMITQCLDAIDREDRGVKTLKRPRAMSDYEAEIVKEAATMLALNGCGGELMREWGFARQAILRSEGRLSNLLSQGVPCSALSLLYPQVQAQNAALVDSMNPRREGAPSRRFVACFDFTYLLKMHSQVEIHSTQGLVGGPFHLDQIGEDSPACFQVIKDGHCEKKEKTKANRMLPGCI